MTCAVPSWACIASPVTRRPSSASVSSSARAAEGLVLALGHRPLGDGDARTGAEGGDDVQRRAAGGAVEGAAQRLAVDGEHPVAGGAEVVEEGLEGAPEGRRIEQAEHPGEGVVARQAILQAQEFPQQRLAVLGELGEVDAALRAADRRDQRDRQDVEQLVPLRIAPPRVGDLSKRVDQGHASSIRNTWQNPDQPERKALFFKCNSPAALIDAVEAVVRPDAGPDVVLAALDDLPHDMRVGHVARVMPTMSSLPLAIACRAVATSLIRAAWKVGKPVAARTSPAKSRCGALGMPWIGITSTSPASVSIWPRMTLRKSTSPLSRSRRAISKPSPRCWPARQALVAGVAHADDEVRAAPRPDRPEHLEREPHPVLERAAERRLEVVGQRRPELVDEMPVGLELDAIEPRRLHPLGGRGIVRDDAGNVPVLDALREGPVRRLALVARRETTGSQSPYPIACAARDA